IAGDHPGARAECESLIRDYHYVDGRRVDLLSLTATNECLDGVGVHGRAYRKCFRREIACRVLGPAAPRSLRLRVTARVREPRGEGEQIMLRFNGECVHTWRASCDWYSVACIVPAILVQPGTNVVTVVWPDPGQRRIDRIEQVLEAFEDMQMLDGGPARD